MGSLVLRTYQVSASPKIFGEDRFHYRDLHTYDADEFALETLTITTFVDSYLNSLCFMERERDFCLFEKVPTQTDGQNRPLCKDMHCPSGILRWRHTFRLRLTSRLALRSLPHIEYTFIVQLQHIVQCFLNFLVMLYINLFFSRPLV